VGLDTAGPVAGLGRRSAAYVLDSLVVGTVYVALAVLFDTLFGPLVQTSPDGSTVVVIAVDPVRVALELAATLVIDGLYFAGSWSRWGASPAQRALGLRIRMAGGAPRTADSGDALPIEAAWLRWAVLAVGPIAVGSLADSGALDPSVLLVVNGAWYMFLLVSAARDPLRRGLHDRVAGTLVVRTPSRRG
jgi:uncharacterized RDD family membrane protein YckC